MSIFSLIGPNMACMWHILLLLRFFAYGQNEMNACLKELLIQISWEYSAGRVSDLPKVETLARFWSQLKHVCLKLMSVALISDLYPCNWEQYLILSGWSVPWDFLYYLMHYEDWPYCLLHNLLDTCLFLIKLHMPILHRSLLGPPCSLLQFILKLFEWVAVIANERNIRVFSSNPFRYEYLYSSHHDYLWMGWIFIVSMFKNILKRSQKPLQSRVVCERSSLMLNALDLHLFSVWGIGELWGQGCSAVQSWLQQSFALCALVNSLVMMWEVFRRGINDHFLWWFCKVHLWRWGGLC